MSLALQFAVAFVFAFGLAGFGGWTIYTYVTTTLPRQADLTSRAVYFCGQGLIWVGVILLAGGLFGLAAGSVWRAINL
jgi:hypothetical protein